MTIALQALPKRPAEPLPGISRKSHVILETSKCKFQAWNGHDVAAHSILKVSSVAWDYQMFWELRVTLMLGEG